MSVFTIIRRGRQAAKEHKDKQVEKQKQETAKIPYRHVPTHAAIDAMSGAPATYREEDRSRIVEANRRRSAMAASGLGRGMPGSMTPVHVGMPGMPRVNSALSHVSYPTGYASPVVQMPRAYSYTHVSQGEMVYSIAEQGGMNGKGKGVERVVDSRVRSRASSKGNSPTGSSSASNSSDDDLEMKPRRATGSHFVSQAEKVESPHRLHPSRRISDPQTMSARYQGQSSLPRPSYYPPSTSSSYVHSRPMPSRASTQPQVVSPGIPPVPALPPMAFGTMSPPGIASSAASTSSIAPSAASSVSHATTAATTPLTSTCNSPTPKAAPASSSSFAEMVPDFAPITPALMEPAMSTTPKSSHSSQSTVRRVQSNGTGTGTGRPTELDRTASHASRASTIGPSASAANARSRASVNAMTLPTEFDEASFGRYQPVTVLAPPEPLSYAQPYAQQQYPQQQYPQQQQPAVAAHKPNRLSKAQGPPKPAQATVKTRSRWSIRGNKAAAATAMAF